MEQARKVSCGGKFFECSNLKHLAVVGLRKVLGLFGDEEFLW